jgi:hypothetical protein
VAEPIKGLTFNDKVLVAQMTLDGLGAATISFFTFVKDRLRTNLGVSLVEMSQRAYMKPNAAKRHVLQLESKGYITKNGMRSWVLGEDLIRDPDLKLIKRIYINAHQQIH